MTYQEVLEFMFNSLPMYQRIGQAAYKADLKTTELLDEHFKHPHQSFKCIHVAGTNGKGSVSHSLASILQEAGYKTGLYTSPHLIDYRERVRVDGVMITEEFVTDFINNNYDIIRDLKPSFFEMSVALAFEYFKNCKVDVAVIEVGMGGRLDSTNIISPELSIITNIGLDHTQFLGDTLDKIAREKAGIIKPKVPVVIGETQEETSQEFNKIASVNNAEIIFADQSELNIEYDFALKGPYQAKNLATIISSIKILQQKNFNIPEKHIISGLKNVITNTGFRGRWEIINKKPLTICDTGHNKEGLTYSINELLNLNSKNGQIRFIIGFVNDKNVEEVLKLFPKNAFYYFTKSSVPRAMDEKILKEIAQKNNIRGESYPDVISAYQQAYTDSKQNDIIFIGGSTFVVGDFLNEFICPEE
ncbi:MAG: bifunctional folylpolyglutamate synthase/dihydrofolate synthase [Bacteroidales bacterium]|nr:bifunctional folylpolyglutamate synthase/dihydrofolate synthase [Bacteroidales bacterium]